MLRRFAIAAGCALLVLILIDRASLFLPPCGASYSSAPNASHDEETYRNYCAAREGVVIAGLETLYSLKPEIWTAIATVVVAAFTGTLWWATTEHSRITDAVLKLARDEFVATHRPRISVRGFQVIRDQTNNDDVTVTFLYVNTGSSDAIVTEIGAKMVVGLEISSEVQFDVSKISGVRLTSGDKEIFAVADTAPLLVAEVRWERDGGRPDQAHLVGFVRYEDSQGRKRETGFCCTYNADSRRWIRERDSEYEYQD